MTVQYCPKCGGIIIEDDMYDTEFSKEEIITQHCGHCPKCSILYQWENRFRWYEATDPVEA